MLIRHDIAAVPMELRVSTRTPDRRMRRGEVLRAPERCDFVAVRVLEGCLRVCHPLHDGRRQITDFLFPGDGIGIGEVRRHNGSIEAVSPSRVSLLSADHLDDEEADLAQARIDAMQSRLFMLGHKNAREKLAAFLLEMSGRIAPAEVSFRLPMSRYDIADYLCLSPETVCRNFTQMVSDGLITLPDSQTVQILHRAPLEFIGR